MTRASRVGSRRLLICKSSIEEWLAGNAVRVSPEVEAIAARLRDLEGGSHPQRGE
jgi:hypothetical protein